MQETQCNWCGKNKDCKCGGNLPQAPMQNWEEKLNFVLNNKCGNIEITNGELVDGTTKPIFNFIHHLLLSKCE